MNKVVNVTSCILLVLFSIFVMILVFDLSLSTTLSLKNMPYQEPICGGFALVIFLLGVLRIKRRWQGMKDLRMFQRFVYHTHVDGDALRHGLVYSVVEIVFAFLFIGLFGVIAQVNSVLVLPMMAVIGFLVLEAIYFAWRISKQDPTTFRIGIDKKAIAYFDREIHLIHFSGLRKIEMHQDMINFQYSDEDLNIFLNLNVIPKEDRATFREHLIKTVEEYAAERNKKTVFIDEAFRTLK